MTPKSEVSVSLDFLKTQLRPIDFAPYEANADSPEWLRRLSEIAKHNFGVLALTRPIAVSVAVDRTKSSRATIDAASLYVAGLGDLVRNTTQNTTQRIAVGLPPVGKHLPLLLAVTSMLSHALQPDTKTKKGRSGILIITPNLDIRSRYCDLLFRGHTLDDEFPGSRLRPDGSRVMLQDTNHTSHSGICFFLPLLNLPTRIDFSPALIVLDLRYACWTPRASSLAEWAATVDNQAGVIGLYTIGDAETLDALKSAKYTDLPIDHSAVATCATHIRHVTVRRSTELMDWTVASAPNYLDRDHQIIEIPEVAALEKLFTDVGALLDDYTANDNLDLKRARWILALLMQMAVPLVWYDEAARSLGRRPLKRLIERLGALSRYEDNLGPVVQTARLGLLRIHETLERSNPRAALLKQHVETMATENRGAAMLFLVRDRTTERAVRNWLAFEACAGADWLADLSVVACPHYAAAPVHRFKAALINGVLPRRYRWIMGSALADKVTFLTYGFESDIVERQLAAIYAKPGRDARAAQRSLTLKALPQRNARLAIHEDDDLPALRLARAPRSANQPAGAGPRKPIRVSLDQLREEWKRLQTAPTRPDTRPQAIWEEDAGSDDGLDENPEQLPSAAAGEADDCLRVAVNSRAHGNGVIWLPPDVAVELIRASAGDDIKRQAASSLRTGDVLLRVDEAGRGSLFERIVELTEGQSEMHYLSRWRQMWRTAVERMATIYRSGSHVDYTRVLRDLQKAKAPIESEAAIRLWVEDLTIGPLSIDSIRAVGHIAGTEALVKQAKEFDNAFGRIRAVHRGIGLRLSHVIRKSFRHGAGVTSTPPRDELDLQFGVPLDELLDTIDLAEVLAVSTGTTRVSGSWIGRFRREG